MSSSSFDRVRIEAERQAQLERERQIRINMAADLEKARSHASVALHRVGNKYNELIEQARGDPMLLSVVKEIDLIRQQFLEETESAALLHTLMPAGVVDHEGYLSKVTEATKAAQAVNPERMEQQLGLRLKRQLEEIKRQFAAYNQSATVRKAVFNHKDSVYMLDEETLQSVLQEPVSERLSALKSYGEQVLCVRSVWQQRCQVRTVNASLANSVLQLRSKKFTQIILRCVPMQVLFRVSSALFKVEKISKRKSQQSTLN